MEKSEVIYRWIDTKVAAGAGDNAAVATGTVGERSLHNNSNARAVFIGMTMDTNRADMTQAVLEGVAFDLWFHAVGG